MLRPLGWLFGEQPLKKPLKMTAAMWTDERTSGGWTGSDAIAIIRSSSNEAERTSTDASNGTDRRKFCLSIQVSACVNILLFMRKRLASFLSFLPKVYKIPRKCFLCKENKRKLFCMADDLPCVQHPTATHAERPAPHRWAAPARASNSLGDKTTDDATGRGCVRRGSLPSILYDETASSMKWSLFQFICQSSPILLSGS